MIRARIGGRWLQEFGAPGPASWVTIADGGCDKASVTLSNETPNFLPAIMRRAVRFELFEESVRVFSGFTREPEVGDSLTIHADGWHREAQHALAMDATLETTSDGHAAVAQAVARGALHWTYRNQLELLDPYTSDGTTTDLKFINQLLDALAKREGKRWGVDEHGEFYWESDPTTPTLMLTPGVGVMGVADDEYASHLYGRRVSALNTEGAPSAWATETVGDAAAAEWLGRREDRVDLTPAGFMSQASALADLQGRLALGKARGGYTNGLEVPVYQIANMGGSRAHLSFVKARVMARQHGVLNESGNLQFGTMHDFVIGRVSYTAGTQAIQLDPIGLADRNFADVTAAAVSKTEGF